MGKGRVYHYYLIDNVQEEERGASEVPPSPIELPTETTGDLPAGPLIGRGSLSTASLTYKQGAGPLGEVSRE